MSWSVYVLRCRDGSLYTGITNNLPRRLRAHRAGRGAAYTRSRLPLRLVYVTQGSIAAGESSSTAPGIRDAAAAGALPHFAEASRPSMASLNVE